MTITTASVQPQARQWLEEIAALPHYGEILYPTGSADDSLSGFESVEEQRILWALIHRLPGMVYRAGNDRDRTMRYVSHGCLALTGYRPADLVNSGRVAYGALIHPDDRQAVWEEVQAALQTDQSFQLTYRLAGPGGSEKWVWEHGRGLYTAQGDPVALEGFVTDITHQVQTHAIAAERSRLARDLHDAVTQTLFSASLIAEVLPRLWERNPAEGRRRLGELRELTRGALAEMRTLLLELRPAALQEVSAVDLLRQLAESLTGRARLPVGLTMRLTGPLPATIKVAFYRIAQEALNNVVKHAGATGVNISLTDWPALAAAGETGRTVELSIRDNGGGFNPAAITADHLGLAMMRERATAAGIRLTIESRIDHGTEIKATWLTERNPAHDG